MKTKKETPKFKLKFTKNTIVLLNHFVILLSYCSYDSYIEFFFKKLVYTQVHRKLYYKTLMHYFIAETGIMLQ